MAFFPSKDPKRPVSAAVHSLLGKGTTWRGEIHAGALNLRVEGHVDGTIHSTGEVSVAPEGLVTGTIHCKHLIVTGRVKGVVKVQGCLEIHGTGQVEGEVEVGSLVVDEGGTLQGNCIRRDLKGRIEPKVDTKVETKAEAKAESTDPKSADGAKATPAESDSKATGPVKAPETVKAKG